MGRSKSHDLQLRVCKRQPSKQCRIRGESHAVPSSWALSCKKCHASRCYPHLLQESMMHSMRALLLQEKDPTAVVYHEDHINKFPDYKKEKEVLLDSQMEGSAPNFNVLMTYNAITFPLCQPVSHRHASLGWYDKVPERPRQTTSGTSGKAKEILTPMDVDSEVEHAHVAHSSGSDSQRSMKNYAYIELKRPKRRRLTSSKLHPSLQLSSASECQSDDDDDDELDSVSRQFTLRPAQ